ncbi:MAG: cell division protein DivIVA, partial [Chitinophagia bacterium]|nr:cell division protein DivIVA [Chitinophagia bacterium]
RGQPFPGRGNVEAGGEGHGPAARAAAGAGHHRQRGEHGVAQGPVGQGGATGQPPPQPAPAAPG